MLFNSMQFAIFFPIAVLLMFIIPYKYRNVYLLAISYFYYMSWEVLYAGLLLLSTLVCYLGGLLIDNKRRLAHKRGVLFLCVFVNLFLLFIFKYLHLFFPKSELNLLLPVGISFYVFRSVSYIADVYKGKYLPEKSFVKYALYVSFFPQLVAGPIERFDRFKLQLNNDNSFDYERVRLGLFRMLWGFFLKLVISERLLIAVNTIYDNVFDVTGYQLILGTFLYAFQIYTDFYSYSEIAIGASKVLGFDAMENFRQPFFAKNCRELWQRWHISLNSWFVDYVYIPLGGSKKGVIRKYINTMIVFVLSGLWHGADLSFVVWGALSGAFQVIGGIRDDLFKKNNIVVCGKGGKIAKLCKPTLQIAGTFILFNVALVFFRADDVYQGAYIFNKMLFGFDFSSVLTTSFFSLGLGVYNMLFLIAAIIVLFVFDLLKEQGKGYEWFLGRKWFIRWGVYFGLVIMILMSAHLGAGEFIYFKF